MRGLRRNMAKLYDEICRTLATPMPRSRALKLIFGGLASAVLAPFGFGQQNNTEQCPNDGSTPCTGVPENCCPPSAPQCCPAAPPSNNAHCCPATQTCCGNSCCPLDSSCVNGRCNPSGTQP